MGGIRLRTLYLLLAISLVFLVLPPTAAAEEAFSCHTWEVFVGDRHGDGAGVSTEDGAVYVGSDHTVPGGFYVTSDGDPVRNPWIFSIWFAQENNGEPGYQRGDEMCDETNGGETYHDCPICCLCVVVPAAAPGAVGGDSFGCHDWAVFVGDRETGAGLSTDTATYLAAGGFYVFNDGAPVVNDWLFSIWLYQEGNGMPGPQRGDEVCDETRGGEFEPDFGCIC